MKNQKALFIKLVVAISAFLSMQSIEAYSQHYHNLEVQAHDNTSLRLKIQANNPLPVWVRVKDAAGITLLKEYSRKGTFSGLINFSKLKEGVYYVEMQREDGVIRRQVLKNSSGMSIQEPEEYIYNFVQLDNNRRLLVRCSSNFGHPLVLRIADKAGKVLHEEKNINRGSHISKINLSGVPDGNYHVLLISGSLVLDKQIRLNGSEITKPKEELIVTAIE